MGSTASTARDDHENDATMMPSSNHHHHHHHHPSAEDDEFEFKEERKKQEAEETAGYTQGTDILRAAGMMGSDGGGNGLGNVGGRTIAEGGMTDVVDDESDEGDAGESDDDILDEAEDESDADEDRRKSRMAIRSRRDGLNRIFGRDAICAGDEALRIAARGEDGDEVHRLGSLRLSAFVACIRQAFLRRMLRYGGRTKNLSHVVESASLHTREYAERLASAVAGGEGGDRVGVCRAMGVPRDAIESCALCAALTSVAVDATRARTGGSFGSKHTPGRVAQSTLLSMVDSRRHADCLGPDGSASTPGSSGRGVTQVSVGPGDPCPPRVLDVSMDNFIFYIAKSILSPQSYGLHLQVVRLLLIMSRTTDGASWSQETDSKAPVKAADRETVGGGDHGAAAFQHGRFIQHIGSHSIHSEHPFVEAMMTIDRHGDKTQTGGQSGRATLAMEATRTLLVLFSKQIPTPRNEDAFMHRRRHDAPEGAGSSTWSSLQYISGYMTGLSRAKTTSRNLREGRPVRLLSTCSAHLLLLLCFYKPALGTRNPYLETVQNVRDSDTFVTLMGRRASVQSANQASPSADGDGVASAHYHSTDGNDGEQGSGGMVYTLFRFGALYATLCSTIDEEESALMLYLLMYNNKHFFEYLVTRSDPDALLLPLLRVVHDESTKHFGSAPGAGTGARCGPGSRDLMYILLIVLLLLSNSDSFVANAFDNVYIRQRDVQWFEAERRHRADSLRGAQAGDVSLGSFCVAVIVSVISMSISGASRAGDDGCADVYLMTNCFAIVSNLVLCSSRRRWKAANDDLTMGTQQRFDEGAACADPAAELGILGGRGAVNAAGARVVDVTPEVAAAAAVGGAVALGHKGCAIAPFAASYLVDIIETVFQMCSTLFMRKAEGLAEVPEGADPALPLYEDFLLLLLSMIHTIFLCSFDEGVHLFLESADRSEVFSKIHRYAAVHRTRWLGDFGIHQRAMTGDAGNGDEVAALRNDGVEEDTVMMAHDDVVATVEQIAQLSASLLRLMHFYSEKASLGPESSGANAAAAAATTTTQGYDDAVARLLAASRRHDLLSEIMQGPHDAPYDKSVFSVGSHAHTHSHMNTQRNHEVHPGEEGADGAGLDYANLRRMIGCPLYQYEENEDTQEFFVPFLWAVVRANNDAM